jgi:ABC-type uncharacterized transport system ATPase subunit
MTSNLLEIVFKDELSELTERYQQYKYLLNRIMTEASQSEFSDLKPFQEKILKRVKYIHENMIAIGLRLEELKLQNTLLLSKN